MLADIDLALRRILGLMRGWQPIEKNTNFPRLRDARYPTRVSVCTTLTLCSTLMPRVRLIFHTSPTSFSRFRIHQKHEFRLDSASSFIRTIAGIRLRGSRNAYAVG